MAFHLIDTSTLQLKDFTATRAPKYAILSHTWEDGQEVSYQEMMAIAAHVGHTHPAMKKSGYQKIVKTCELARAENLDYAWVDTCCIDKSSSAELSEAINPMFQWYKSAAICYTHLSDLHDGNHLDDTLPRCRWFTRGWCLQELIAPREVLFFDRDWQLIGRKTNSAFLALVCAITKIAETVLLDPRNLPNIAVAQKMSWAANRETTRIEDMAYCLLGIFDINMPMLYGEGSKAFRRLQEEIIKGSNDLSIFAWLLHAPEEASMRPDWLLQTARPADFINLFAESPHEFLGCHTLERLAPSVERNCTFAMTNNGLLISGAIFQLDFSHGLYALLLAAKGGKEDFDKTGFLALKRIDSNRFVRVHHFGTLGNCETVWAADRDSSDLDLFVIPDIRHFDFGYRVAGSKARYIQLRNRVSEDVIRYLPRLYESVLEIFPKECWDASLGEFVLHPDNALNDHGYVKFNGPKFLSDICHVSFHNIHRVSDFYLLWELGKLTKVPVIAVKLYDEGAWMSLPRSMRTGESYKYGYGPVEILKFDTSDNTDAKHRSLPLGFGRVAAHANLSDVLATGGHRLYIDISYKWKASSASDPATY